MTIRSKCIHSPNLSICDIILLYDDLIIATTITTTNYRYHYYYYYYYYIVVASAILHISNSQIINFETNKPEKYRMQKNLYPALRSGRGMRIR